ncbi:MAG: protease complex subunit PrcB family protein [Longimicrobiaceae bacterium]
MQIVVAAVLLAACGPPESSGRTGAAAPPRVATAPVRASPDTASRHLSLTRFAPGDGEGVPEGLSGFCQSLRNAPGPGPAWFDTTTAQRMPGALLRTDIESHLDAPLRCIVRNQREWDAIRPLTSIHPDSVFPAPAPDFRREMLVVAAMGSRPTILYDIVVNGTWLRGDTLVVTVTSASPQGDVVGDMGTNPVVVARVPRARTVLFLERE